MAAPVKSKLIDNKLPKSKYRANHPRTVEVMKLRHKGLSVNKVAEITAIPRSTVYAIERSVTDMIASTEELNQYREQQAAVMDTIAMAYGSRLLDKDAIKGASALQAASVMGIAVDKSRLIKGQSSVNIAMLFSQAMTPGADEE